MKKSLSCSIKLVFTVALKKEIPKSRLALHHIPVHSLAALKSGALNQPLSANSGMLIVVTGAGQKNSEEAASWIRDNLTPLFVVNIGTCGLTDKKRPLGKWIRPRYAANEEGKLLELDTRLPFPFSGDIIDVRSLISVEQASSDNIRKYDAVDMECYPQAKIFHDANINFHCLKFGTDYSNSNMLSDFNKHIDLFAESAKELYNFPDDSRKTTVVIPVYNRQHTIKRAVDSVLSQSYMPEEIIVVDDCSTDGTAEILGTYGDKLTVVSLRENSGPSRARNEGIKRAKTGWLAFLDSDDCWEKDKLKDQIAYLEKYPFFQIMQSEEIWIRKGKRVNPCKHHKKPEGWIWESSLERCLISPSGVLVKKSLLEKYGLFDEGLPVCEDYDLWLKISRHHPVGLAPDFSVIKYGGHEDQLSRKYPAMDRFRAKSLMRLLENEAHPDFRQKIIRVLKKKLNILIKGYEKRGKLKEAEESQEMIKVICKS